MLTVSPAMQGPSASETPKGAVRASLVGDVVVLDLIIGGLLLIGSPTGEDQNPH